MQKNKKAMTLHDFIINSIASFEIKIKEVSEEEFHKWYEECPINYSNKQIEIRVCRDEINWIKEGKLKFASKCYVDVESVNKGLKINGDYVDAYGSIIVGDELLLNNYDADFYEQEKNEKGFCNILGFATVNKNGNVRFSQIVYSFLFNKIIIRDDVTFCLPFIPDLKNDFGGKRATYRIGSSLSLRTNLSVYEKVDKKYWQPDSRKSDLSYPRLILL